MAFSNKFKPLCPSEIPEHLIPGLDFSSQESAFVRGKNRNTILRVCLKCSKTKRILVGPVRYGVKYGQFTGLCVTCSSGGRSSKAGTCRQKGSGRKIRNYGYVMIYRPDHPYTGRNRYVMEHRLVMEQSLGRYLTSLETVHHKNGIRDDNRLENLELRIGNHGQGQLYEDLSIEQLQALIHHMQGVIKQKTSSN